MSKKKTYFLVVLLFLIVSLPSSSQADSVERVMMEERNQKLKQILNINEKQPSQEITMAIAAKKEGYSISEPIDIECALLNKTTKNAYYWTCYVGDYDILIWYQHNFQWKFIYWPSPLRICTGNVPAVLKPGESLNTTLTLKPEDVPQIYADIQHPGLQDPAININHLEIFVCAVSDELQPDQEKPEFNYPVGYPRGEPILAKSNWARIKITRK